MRNFITPESLAHAEALLEAMRKGDELGACSALAALADVRESAMFREIGAITRDLHDSLRQFAEDTRLTQLVAEDVPDARERLRYVTTLTEQAANRTLEATEKAKPLTNNMIKRSQRIVERLAEIKQLNPGNQPLNDASGPVELYLASVTRDAGQVHDLLTEIVMAQEFQDLTGQLLHRVIHLLEHLEHEMVKLIQVVGMTGAVRDKGSNEDLERGQGPALPSASANVVHSQDEVDDLLASLGF